jgi:flagellar hook-associated protein FlgK
MTCENCGHIEKRTDKLDDRVNTIDKQVSGLEARVVHVENTTQSINSMAKDIGSIQQQMTHFEGSRLEDRDTHKRMFDKMDEMETNNNEKFGTIIKEIGEMKGKMTPIHKIVIAVIIALLLANIGLQ